MSSKSEKESASDPVEKVSVTLPATVEKIIPSLDPKESEKAQIHIPKEANLSISGASYSIIPVVRMKRGRRKAKLKIGSRVEVTIEAGRAMRYFPRVERSANFDPKRNKVMLCSESLLENRDCHHLAPTQREANLSRPGNTGVSVFTTDVSSPRIASAIGRAD